MRINLKRTIDTFLFISHTKNLQLFKFRCNIFIGVRIIKEMPGSVASGTHCTYETKTERKINRNDTIKRSHAPNIPTMTFIG